MKICLLAYGSLINNSKGLKIGQWNLDGCLLPLDYVRVSKDLRLTLAIDEKQKVLSGTYWSLFKYKTLKPAILELAKREKIKSKFIANSIGIIDIKNSLYNEGAAKYKKETLTRIIQWAKGKNIDIVIFSALSKRFKDAVGIRFTPENGIMFLQSLPPKNKELAINYIKATPRIDTPFKQLFNQHVLNH